MEADNLSEEIMEFIQEKVRDLDTDTFLQVLGQVCDDLEVQIEAAQGDD